MKDVKIPDLLPYNPKYNLALADNVPYNVVDSQNLKNELLTNANKLDETRKPFTGTEITLPWLNKEKYGAFEVKGKVKSSGETKDVSRRVYTLKDIDINKVELKVEKQIYNL